MDEWLRGGRRLEWGLSEQRIHLGRFRPVSSKDTNSDYDESFDFGEEWHEHLVDVNRKDGNEDNVKVRVGAPQRARRAAGMLRDVRPLRMSTSVR